jgi:hypothetical protein
VYEYQQIFIDHIARAFIESELDGVDEGDLSDSVPGVSKMS